MINGTTADKPLPDGRLLTVIPILFGRARLTVGPQKCVFGYDDVW